MTFVLSTKITADSAQAQRAFRTAGRAVDSVRGSFTRAGGAAARFAQQFGALAGIAGGLSFAGFAASTVQATLELDRLQRRMVAAFGSQQLANREMEVAASLARRLGTDLIATSRGYARLMVSARGTRLEGEQAREVFEGIITATSALGLSSQELEGALVAVEQMISKGNVSAEELRGQLGERLPGAFQIAARSMGVTTTELGKMLEQGELLAEDFLPQFAEQLKREYAGIAAAASESFDAQRNRLNTFRIELQGALGREAVSFATAAFAQLNEDFSGDAEDMKAAAADLGREFVGVMRDMAVGAARVFDQVSPLAETITGLAGRLIRGFNQLPPFMQELGIVGALLFGVKGRAAILALSAASSFISADDRERLDVLVKKAGRLQEGIRRAQANGYVRQEEEFQRQLERNLSAQETLRLRMVAAADDPAAALNGPGPAQQRVENLFLGVDRRQAAGRVAQSDGRQPNAGGGMALSSGGGAGGGGGGGRGDRDAADKIAADHERAARAIQIAYERTLDPVAEAEAAAARFREEALAGLNQNAAGYDDLVDKVNAVSESIRRQPHTQALDEIRAAYDRLKPASRSAVAEVQAWRTNALAHVQAAGEGYEEFAGIVEAVFQDRLKEAYDEDLRNREDWLAGVERGLRRVLDRSETVADGIDRTVSGAFRSLEDTLVSLDQRGSAAFSDLINSILDDIQRLAVQQLITQPLARLLLGQVGGSAGGGGGATAGLAAGAAGGLLGSVGNWLFGGSATPDMAQPNALGGATSGGGVLSGVGDWFSGAFDGIGNFFAGLFDKGGTIPAGQFGIVGERRPEIVTGPAEVIPLDNLRAAGGPPPMVNVYLNVQTQGAVEPDEPRVSRTPDGLQLDLLVRQVDGAIGERVRQGTSQTGRALVTEYGLERGRGAG